ncbi:MAG: tripartite tricarboxylate transporter permease [Haloferacaceae archaeon]
MVFEQFVHGLSIVLSVKTLGYLLLGILAGIFVGAIPGIGPTIGMVILLPFTLLIEPIHGIVFLVAIFNGSMYGSSIPAILLNTPGAAGSAATTFDGYELSKQGEAAAALSTSAVSSAFGGLIASVVVMVLTPFLVPIVLMFGSPEYFLIAFLGLVLITVVTEGSMTKGIVAGAIGVLLTTVGVATTGATRYTFGLLGLYNGVSFIAVLIGLFAVTEMVRLSEKQSMIAEQAVEITGDKYVGFRQLLAHPWLVIKSSLIGVGIGSLPGSGASVSNFVAYAEAIRSLPSIEFRTGVLEGVIAPEASNNATVSGALVPTLSFGIPGSGATAVLLGGLLMMGIRPGPPLFRNQLHLTYAIYLTLFIGGLMILVIGTTLVTRLGFVTMMDTDRIIPLIVVLSTLGAIALRNNWIDVLTVMGTGILGYYLIEHDYSIIALVLGAVLGSTVERNFLRSLQVVDGGPWMIFVSSPIAIVLTLAIVFLLVSSNYRTVLNLAKLVSRGDPE